MHGAESEILQGVKEYQFIFLGALPQTSHIHQSNHFIKNGEIRKMMILELFCRLTVIRPRKQAIRNIRTVLNAFHYV